MRIRTPLAIAILVIGSATLVGCPGPGTEDQVARARLDFLRNQVRAHFDQIQDWQQKTYDALCQLEEVVYVTGDADDADTHTVIDAGDRMCTGLSGGSGTGGNTPPPPPSLDWP
jgi:hypothetical protein